MADQVAALCYNVANSEIVLGCSALSVGDSVDYACGAWQVRGEIEFHREHRMNIYVGKIAYEATDEDLRQAFEAHGEVGSATIIMDRYSGRSRGFGFVEMPSSDEANAAIEALNGSELRGRPIVVNE